MAEELFKILEEFDISEKLFCITTDAAKNNTTLVRNLSRILCERKGIKWNYKEMHINCLDHVINLAVQEFLQTIKVVQPINNEDDEDDDDDKDGEDDEDDEDDENDESDGENEIIEGEEGSFVNTMAKVRGIAKVLCSTLFYVTCKSSLPHLTKALCTLQLKIIADISYWELALNNGKSLFTFVNLRRLEH